MLSISYNGYSLHHAYLLIGGKETTRASLHNFLTQAMHIDMVSNPDVTWSEYNTFMVEHARDLAFSQTIKPLEGEKRIFVIMTNSITEDAQNALLKVFEEPMEGVHFFIVMPQDTLLPTLRSRMSVLFGTVPEALGIKGEKLTELPLQHRMALVKKITDDISDEKKVKQDAIDLLNQIEFELYVKGVKKFAEELRICENARVSLYDRGAPIKMILEHVMLAL